MRPSGGNQLRDTRLHYAEEVMAMMVINACGGTEADADVAIGQLGDGIERFMRFANAGQGEFFIRRLAT